MSWRDLPDPLGLLGLLAVPIEASPRSVLVGIAPMAAGTALGESFSSYVTRLAWAHDLAPSRLVRHVAAPALGRPNVIGESDGDWGAYFAAIFRADRASLNGTGVYAATWSEAFGTLTGRSDLGSLTLLAWADVLTAKRLLRAERAYCPACYDEWAAARCLIYEPLLWQFRSLERCPTHDVRLRTRCPNPACGAVRGVLATWARPGWCERCATWLGTDLEEARRAEPRPSDQDLDWQRSVGTQIGRLVAASGSVHPDAGSIEEAVTWAIDRAAGGNLSEFARRCRVDLSTASYWRSGRSRPSLDGALRICRVGGFELVDFLSGDLAALRGTPEPAPDVRPWVPPSAEPHRRIDWRRVEAALRDALVAEPPPPLNRFLRNLGVDDGVAKCRLPELCRAVRDRHRTWRAAVGADARERKRAEIRQVMAEIHAEGRRPSRHQITKRMRGLYLRGEGLQELWREELHRLGY